MARSDRFLALVQMLRRHRQPVTAEAIAREFDVSVRTVYRDIVHLQGAGVPIRGEAGIGYILDPGFDLPPLMFSPDELEALMLGARFVQDHGDPGLARAADDAIAKIMAVLPPALKPLFADAPVFASPVWNRPEDRVDAGLLRRAIRAGRKLRIDYADEQGRRTERVVWPIAVGYMAASRMLVAWCELRSAFRTFRADRIERLDELDVRYPTRRAVLLKAWQEQTRHEKVCFDPTRSPPWRRDGEAAPEAAPPPA